MRPAATPPASAVGHPAPELSLTVRRALVFVALAGYPLFVAAWLVLRDVLPGIAGLAQVSGRSDLTYAETVHYDLQYVEQHSLLTDAGILVRALVVVLKGSGAR